MYYDQCKNIQAVQCANVIAYDVVVIGAILPSTIDTHAVFANNELDLAEVEVYGFDYDYTLAGYSDALRNVIFEMGKRALVNKMNVRNFEYELFILLIINNLINYITYLLCDH